MRPLQMKYFRDLNLKSLKYWQILFKDEIATTSLPPDLIRGSAHHIRSLAMTSFVSSPLVGED